VQNRVSVGLGELNRVVVRQGELAGVPHVWTRGVRTSPLALPVSPPRVLQLATAPSVAWTEPFRSRCPLSRARRRFRVAAVASASSRARISVSPVKQLHPVLRKPLLSTVVELVATAEHR